MESLMKFKAPENPWWAGAESGDGRMESGVEAGNASGVESGAESGVGSRVVQPPPCVASLRLWCVCVCVCVCVSVSRLS